MRRHVSLFHTDYICCKVCDFILVLSKGRAVQKGTHKDLLSCSGVYKQLWDLQASMYNEIC